MTTPAQQTLTVAQLQRFLENYSPDALVIFESWNNATELQPYEWYGQDQPHITFTRDND